jgi:hypothetical protein
MRRCYSGRGEQKYYDKAKQQQGIESKETREIFLPGSWNERERERKKLYFFTIIADILFYLVIVCWLAE